MLLIPASGNTTVHALNPFTVRRLPLPQMHMIRHQFQLLCFWLVTFCFLPVPPLCTPVLVLHALQLIELVKTTMLGRAARGDAARAATQGIHHCSLAGGSPVSEVAGPLKHASDAPAGDESCLVSPGLP